MSQPEGLPNTGRRVKFVAPMLTALMALSCGWVDDAGNGTVPGNTIENASGEIDQNIRQIRNDQDMLALNESSSTLVVITDPDYALSGWSSRISERDDNSVCAEADGWDTALSADRLDNACTHADDCTLNVSESSYGSQPAFTLTIPTLRAPVALEWTLSTIQADGSSMTFQQTLCLQSINEAPEAANDHYRAIAGETRQISAQDSDHLMANDQDDLDAHNQALSVMPDLQEEPAYGTLLALGNDGSFSYHANAAALDGSNGTREDRFVYQLSDGTHVSSAVATIEISADNSTPRRDRQVSDQSAWVGASYTLSLADHFSDADGDALRYNIDPDSLPESGRLILSEAGILQGTPHASDVGRYELHVIVSDGLESVEDFFYLDIIEY